MSNITKDKNIYVFEITTKDDKVRTYHLDVNTAVLVNARTQKSVAGCPTGMVKLVTDNSDMSNVIRYMYKTHWYNSRIGYGSLNPNFLAVCDKLDNIGYKISDYYYIEKELKAVSENFSLAAKIISENETPDNHISLHEICELIYSEMFKKQYNLTNTHLTNHQVELIADWYFNSSRYPALAKKHLSRLVYFAERGMFSIGEDFQVLRWFDEMLKFVDSLNLEEIPKGDFTRVYHQLYTNYEMNRAQIEDNKIKEFNYLPELEFENDLYKVIIPTTVEEFKAEGTAQHNCVYSMYLPKVLDEETRVVFIRSKDNLDKSLITCEVSLGGNIIQYLKACNTHCTEQSEREFYSEYLNHLRNFEW
jgi:hypothetical protein